MRLAPFAAFGALLIASSFPAYASEPEDCNPKPTCYETVTKKKIVGYKRVPVYKTYKKKVKVPCEPPCERPTPAEATVRQPPPVTVEVPQDVFVRVVPRIHYVRPNIGYEQYRCCPPGMKLDLPPCPPGQSPFSANGRTDNGKPILDRVALQHGKWHRCQQPMGGRMVS